LDKGKDALIYCSGQTLSTCSVVDISAKAQTSSHFIYYANAGDNKEIHPLIQCSNKECRTVSSKNGYYLNNDDQNSSNPLLSCVNNVCTPVVKVYACNGNVGKILYSNQKYYLCTSGEDTGNGDYEIKSGQTVIYKDLTVTASSFPGTSETSIRVKVGADGSVTLVEYSKLPTCKESHSNECQDSENSNVNACITADGKIYQKNGDNCDIVSNGSNPGAVNYYFINDLTTISSGRIDNNSKITMAYQCIFGDSGALSSCQLIQGYVLANSKLISCNGIKGELCQIVDEGTGISDCSKDGSIINNASFCVKKGDTSKNLSEFASGKTIALSISDSTNIYNKNVGEVIFISLTDKQAILTSGTVGYHIDASDGTKIIHCINNVGIECSSSSHSGIDTSPKHYLQAADANNGVITCNASNGCILTAAANVKGYFLSSDGIEGKSVISCDGSTCSLLEDTNLNACTSNIGKIKVSGSDVYLCITSIDTDDDTNQKKILNDGSTPEDQNIEVESNVFPGISSAGSITVTLNNKGSVLYKSSVSGGGGSTPSSLQSCSGTCTQDEYCVDNNVVKTKSSQDDSCVKITGSQSTSSIVYFKSDNTIVENPEATDAPDMAYQCTFDGEGNASKCILAKGYSISGTNLVSCNGISDTACTVTDISSAPENCNGNGTNQGNLIASSKLCIGTTEFTISENGIFALKLTQANDIYGKSPDDIVILSVSSKYAVLVEGGIIGIINIINKI